MPYSSQTTAKAASGTRPNTATNAGGALQSYFVPGDQGLVLENCTFAGNSSPGLGGAAETAARAPEPSDGEQVEAATPETQESSS